MPNDIVPARTAEDTNLKQHQCCTMHRLDYTKKVLQQPGSNNGIIPHVISVGTVRENIFLSGLKQKYFCELVIHASVFFDYLLFLKILLVSFQYLN